MELSLKEGRMTISIDFDSSDENQITTEEVLIGVYDIISRVFSQEQVIRAYRNTDPSTMDLRTRPESPEDVAEELGNALEARSCAHSCSKQAHFVNGSGL